MLSCNSRQKVINLQIDFHVDIDWAGCLELTRQYDQDLSSIKELSIVPYGVDGPSTPPHQHLSAPPPLNTFQIESTCLVMRVPQDLMLISKIRSKSIELSIPEYIGIPLGCELGRAGRITKTNDRIRGSNFA